MKVVPYLDLVKVQSKVTNSESIISGKVVESNQLSKFHESLNQFYKSNALMYHEKKTDNPYINQSMITDLINTQRILFEMNYTSNKERNYLDGAMTYKDHFFNSTFAGLKTYKNHTDKIRTATMNKYINMLKTQNIDYGITELHLAFDIILDSAIENFMPIKLTKSVNICNPLEQQFKTTMYIESTYNPKLKAYLYCKVTKERLSTKNNIYRFEIRFKDMHNISKDPYKIIEYIEENIQSYKLFHFDDIQLCNKFKEQYSQNIKKVSSQNVPEKLLRELKEHGTEIRLILPDEIKEQIISMFDISNETKKCKILKPRVVFTLPKITQISYICLDFIINTLHREFLLKVYPPTINSPPLIYF